MRRVAVALAALAWAPGARADPPPQERVFVETVAPAHAYVGQPVRVVLRVGYDDDWFAAHAVSVFRRPTDVRFQVEAPWLDALEGAGPFPTRAAPDDGPSPLLVAANDGVVPARDAGTRRDAQAGPDPAITPPPTRSWRLVEIERRWIPHSPGTLALADPRVRFAYANRFEEDLVGGRVAVDLRHATALGRGATVRVDPLPREGMPAGFSGLVGRYRAHAHASAGAPRVGETTKLTLRVEDEDGEGNLSAVETPRLALDGFHVYGALDDRGAPVRTIVYDVAATRTVRSVPAIEIAYFDPGPPAAYRVARTAPIPLAVTGGAPVPVAPSERVRGRSYFGWIWLGLGIAFAGIVWGMWRRRRAPAPAIAPLPSDATGLAAALTQRLAARLRCPPGAVVGPDLAARLAAAGVGADLAARAAQALDRLIAARYGAPASPGDVEEARAVLAALDAPPAPRP